MELSAVCYELWNNHLICFQVLIEITEVSSVITWDFDVCKGDVIFNIYHSRRAPQPVKRDGLSAHNLACPAGNNVQLIDRSWMLGQDYSMVETALSCREGESVQVRSLMKPVRSINMAYFTIKHTDQKMRQTSFCSDSLPLIHICPIRDLMWRAGLDSTSGSGVFTAAHHALLPVGRV